MGRKKPQKKVRAVNSYPHLPKLPTEIIMQILLLVKGSFASYWEGTFIETNSVGLELHNKSILPQVVFDPSILKPHYVNAIRSNWKLETVVKKPLKLSVLTDKRISKYLKLQVNAKTWELVHGDMDILRMLTEHLPQRWVGLFLQVCESTSTMAAPLLRMCKPCYPYLTSLTISSDCIIERLPISLAPRTTKDMPASPTAIARADVPIGTLPFLCNYGALYRVARLEFSLKERESQNASLSVLPEILSNMPYLQVLQLEGLYTDEQFDLSNLPKVNSESLRTISILDGVGEDVLTFLVLFSNCPIRFLDVDGDTGCLKELSEHFSHLKKLIYVSDYLQLLFAQPLLNCWIA